MRGKDKLAQNNNYNKQTTKAERGKAHTQQQVTAAAVTKETTGINTV
jgi:hypothetical protein